MNAKVKRRNTNRILGGLWRPAVILVVLAIVAYGVMTIRHTNADISTLSSLPWSYSETTMSPSASLSLVMQVDGDAAGCRIVVNGVVRDEHLVAHQSAAVVCNVNAA